MLTEILSFLFLILKAFPVNSAIPYRGNFRRGKVTKFLASDENFPRRKLSSTNHFKHKLRIKLKVTKVFASDENFPQRDFP